MLQTLWKILHWIGPYKKRLYLGTLCSFLATWCTAIPVMVTAVGIDRAIQSTRTGETLPYYFVFVSFALIALSVLLRYLLSYKKALLQDSIGTERAAEDRIRIGERLKRVPLGYFVKNSTGDILTDLTSEYSQLELYSMNMVNTVLNGYINFAAIAVFLLFFRWRAGIIAIAGAALSGVFLAAINRESKKNTPVNQKASEDLTAAVLQYIRGLPVIKSYGQNGAAYADIAKTFRESKEINIKIEKCYTPWNALHLLSLKFAAVGVIADSALGYLAGEVSLSVLIMMSMFAFFMFGGVEAVNNSAHVFGMLSTALDKIEQLEQVELIDLNGVDLPLNDFDVTFEQVHFSYHDSREVLTDVSFYATEKTTTAIVGPSGSGKTTICTLLARFYDVTGGSIRIGGTDVRKLTCDSLLKNISMVFQEVYLFRDTIRNNILFGNPDAGEEEIIASAKAARCHDFIMELPDGYDTMIGEEGSTLSGGEKQRISIARAFLKNAPIIILDEATASIDPENEHLIQAAISELTADKTVFIIAHRLATVEHADQILVLEEGRIVQRGTHKQLVKQEGLYKTFVEIRQQAEGWMIG